MGYGGTDDHTMSGLTLDDAKDAKADAQNGNLRDNDAGIPDEQAPDYQTTEIPIVKGHPECLITFDRIVGVSPFNTTDNFLNAKDNLERGGPHGYGNDIVVTVQNPTLVEGQLWVEDHDFRDLRVLGDPKADASPYESREDVVFEDGEPVDVNIKGVDLGMGKFDGEPRDGGFDTEYVQFFISSNRATQILGQLDTAGKWTHTREGEFTEGIVEAPPKLGDDDYDADSHGTPRAIGYPELRADMVDQRGAISWTFGEDPPSTQSPVDVTVYRVIEGEDGPEMEGLAPLTPEDDAYAKPTYPRGGNLYYDHDGEVPEDGEGGSGTPDPEAVGADADPTSDQTVGDVTPSMGDSPDTLTYGALSEAAQEFVDDAVSTASDFGIESTDEIDGFDEKVATLQAENGDVMATADDLAAIVDERLGGTESA